MRVLVLLLMCGAANASVGCYTYGSITTCGDGVSIYRFVNMSQVITPQGSTTVYNYDNGKSGTRTIMVPRNSVPKPYLEPLFDTPLLKPSLD